MLLAMRECLRARRASSSKKRKTGRLSCLSTTILFDFFRLGHELTALDSEQALTDIDQSHWDVELGLQQYFGILQEFTRILVAEKASSLLQTVSTALGTVTSAMKAVSRTPVNILVFYRILFELSCLKQ